MHMKLNQTGSVFVNNGLWYYSVRLPGEKRRRQVPLRAPNSNHTMRADRPRKMAEDAAARYWEEHTRQAARHEPSGATVDQLCAALRKMHFPRMLVTLLLLTYRYVGVMTEELAVMTDAYQLRAPGQKGIHISAWGSFQGQLLLRSMDRAQELYSSMLLRGYHEHFHYADVSPFHWTDLLYIAGSAAVFFFFRYFNTARLIGTFFVR